MAEPAKKQDTVEIPLEKLDRLLQLVERQSRAIERLLNREEHAARRAANLAGPTTAEAEAHVARKLKKWASK